MKVIIIDTGCANLASVAYAVKRLGYDIIISDEPAVLKRADRLFLPGVGTAEAAMRSLENKALIEPIKSLTQPVLGICLGMQLLAKTSEEGKKVIPMLSKIDYSVELLKAPQLPLPHMGWNQVSVLRDSLLFKGIPTGSDFYFVHSYRLAVSDVTLGITEYGEPFSSVIQQGNFFGVQFHPERSGPMGLRLIQNFLEYK